ncbi:MAG: hypothetical protein HOF74_03355 [Gammaproteobacteria bacterium]|jgi:hypothetical protein|nr:hypothetical protein [Gammaproteobacteria bacterium]MBT3858841.1 hypothetical protein [Gammaproteobacteria bacterium]MBT3986192.1 hypothetical protein [Gammaproteobacteria bacterium]MBT4256711.1 hypothetical protein [Gammaproteobacteria bacterium]MBT4581358.1 hypothetical protein [Gammaproteobacteria bacterium]
MSKSITGSKRLLISFLALMVVSACTATASESGMNFNLMSDEEILAYNATQDRVWDEVLCIREVRIQSRIKKRHCATASNWNKRGISSAEQLNIISFGTPQIFH